MTAVTNVKKQGTVSRVSHQNGVSRLYIFVELYHSGRKPLVWSTDLFPNLAIDCEVYVMIAPIKQQNQTY